MVNVGFEVEARDQGTNAGTEGATGRAENFTCQCHGKERSRYIDKENVKGQV